MASFSGGSSAWTSSELILAASHGGPIAAYDALTGRVVAQLPAANNTPRHGLAIATVAGTAFVVASHVCPVTGTGSIRLLQWCSPAPALEFPVPEPVAPIVSAPYSPYLLAGGASGTAYALALPSGAVTRRFRAVGHGGGAVSCLALSDDGSFLVSGGDDGGVAAFLLLDVLDVEAAAAGSSTDDDDLAVCRIASAHAAPVTRVACGQGGCNAVVASASADGTCKVWRLADGSHVRTLALPCCTVALSVALDSASTSLYAGGSDGRVHAASLIRSTATSTATPFSHVSDVIGVALASGCKNLVSCAEDGEVRVWDLTSGGGLLLANAFWLGSTVSCVLVVKTHSGEVVRCNDGGGFKVRDDVVACTRAREVLEMEKMLRASQEDRASSVALLETNLNIHKRCLKLIQREITAVANGGSRRDDATVISTTDDGRRLLRRTTGSETEQDSDDKL